MVATLPRNDNNHDILASRATLSGVEVADEDEIPVGRPKLTEPEPDPLSINHRVKKDRCFAVFRLLALWAQDHFSSSENKSANSVSPFSIALRMAASKAVGVSSLTSSLSE